MPYYRLRLEWDNDYATRERAKQDLADIFEEIQNLSVEDGEPTATLQVLDVQSLPRDRTREVTRRYNEDPDFRQEVDEARFTLVPEATITHPWDQNLWIFPDDHPMAQYERAAYNKEKKARKEMLELGEADQALPPAHEPDPED